MADNLHVNALTRHGFETHTDIVERRPIAGSHQVVVVRVRRALMAGGQFDESGRQGVRMNVDRRRRLCHRAMVAVDW